MFLGICNLSMTSLVVADVVQATTNSSAETPYLVRFCFTLIVNSPAGNLRFAPVRGHFRERGRPVEWKDEHYRTPLAARRSRGRPAHLVGQDSTIGPTCYPGPPLSGPAALERPAHPGRGAVPLAALHR